MIRVCGGERYSGWKRRRIKGNNIHSKTENLGHDEDTASATAQVEVRIRQRESCLKLGKKKLIEVDGENKA